VIFRTRFLAGWLAAAALGAVIAPSVHAQPTAARDGARRAFEAGMGAARAGDWAGAHDRFTEAYGLAPLPGILMNLAGAQRQTGRFVEAAASYRRWLAEVTDDSRDARHRPTVEHELTEVLAATPRLAVTVSGGLPGDVVEADGVQVLPESGPVLVDPGSHRVTLVRGGAVVAEAAVEASVGATGAVALTAPPPATPVAGPDEAAATLLARRRAEEPALPPPTTGEGGGDAGVWIAVGTVGGIIAVAGVVVAVVLATSASPSPYQGSFGPGTVRLP